MMNRHSLRILSIAVAFACFVCFVCQQVLAQGTTESRPDTTPLIQFDSPAQFSYGSFENAVQYNNGAASIRSKNGQGGFGTNTSFDLQSASKHCVVLKLRVAESNQADTIAVQLNQPDKQSIRFEYDLRSIPRDQTLVVYPRSGKPLGKVTTNPTQWQLQGDWRPKPLHVTVEWIGLALPTEESNARRESYEKQQAKIAAETRARAERKKREVENALKAMSHPADGPNVTSIAMVAPDLVWMLIEDRDVTLSPQQIYKAQTIDQIEEKGHDVLAWKGDSLAVTKMTREVQRDRQSIGVLAGAFGKKIWSPPKLVGTPLNDAAIDSPEAYRLTVDREPATLVAVYRKSKPYGLGKNQPTIRHEVFLKLTDPLRSGANLKIDLLGINTRQKTVSLEFDSRTTATPALHVSQIGYRPDDPAKRAYLSTWMGTGGPLRYDADAFEVFRSSDGEVVFQGQIDPVFSPGEDEGFSQVDDSNQTPVYALDFAEVTEPGRYQIHVPGIGCSAPITISETTWQSAFQVSMQGFLHHRSGIELGPPTTDYVRPRPKHPKDGFRVYPVDITLWDGESSAMDKALRRLLKDQDGQFDPRRLSTVDHAWGGYMDAGDWDRRSQHLSATLLHLELFDLFPDYFSKLKLSLPNNETTDSIPDLLNEAIWNVDCYRRMQLEDGGVCGGIESTAHPRDGEASWQESLVVGRYLPDPETSSRYAAAAARLARVLQSIDPKLSSLYRLSAIEADNWVSKKTESSLKAAADRGVGKIEQIRQRIAQERALATIELLWLTQDPTYADRIQNEKLLSTNPYAGRLEISGLFAYCRLPESLSDNPQRKAALQLMKQIGERALAFAGRSAFDITLSNEHLPLIGYTCTHGTPEGPCGSLLPRLHFLTGDKKYLTGAVLATQFAAGANPMNLTMTTGIGWNCPQQPLHIDSRVSGQVPPKGITVYGPHDPKRTGGAYDWAHQWFLGSNMVPYSRSWPVSEFYVDLPNWPVMTEYTVHQTLGPTSYYWGYLAARDSQ